MTQATKGIQVVQYHEGLAKEIAKMWNLSRDGWGGDTRVMTEEQVKTKEAHSENIELYLAIDGEEVVGYCSLSEYKEDTGSLYIPLLNVRSDYHGKKIGKMLVLKALEKTIELGWPRLDLYTWPGNTKAVPLYKKCGFFWEDRDDSTHLMNFIPTVLNTPLLKSVFRNLDWYSSSVRQIEVKPDGHKENGFTNYEYSWQKDNMFARVQFERTGRGMNLIETDEFLLELKLGEHEMIEQESRTFDIKLINKTDAPMSFKAFGKSDARVQYAVDTEQTVEDQAVISGQIIVKPGDEPSNWKTHPYLSVTVWVNDQECELRLGVFPVPPATLTATYSSNLSYLNQNTSIQLEVKNNLKEHCDFTIQLPENELVRLEQDTIYVELEAGQRKTITIPLTILKYGFYHRTIHLTARKADNTLLSFQQQISAAFKGFGEKFGGESKEHWFAFNGLTQIKVRKRDLLMTVSKNNLKNQPIALFPPKLGKPFSNEFSKIKPSQVTWETDDSAILFKIVQDSNDKKGLELTQTFQVFGDGIVHRWISIENVGNVVHEDIHMSSSLFHELVDSYFPLEAGIVQFNAKRILEFGDLKPTSITGNWYFSENTPYPIGVTWSNKNNATPEGWQFVIEDRFEDLEPGVKKSSEMITISVGAFNEWEEFQAFANKSVTINKANVGSENFIKSDKLIVDSDSELSLALKTFRNSYLNGQLELFVNEKEHYQTELKRDDERTEHPFSSKILHAEPVSIIEGTFISESHHTHLEELILVPSQKEPVTILNTENEMTTYEVNNGIIKIKSAPDFYPGLYSIRVNDSEWLDTSFPNKTAKSWWNPWAGGMKTVPASLNTFSLMKEKHSTQSIELQDLNGNNWSGLAIHTEMKEHSGWKGVEFTQYYLMLPGVPVLATFLEVKHDGGKNLNDETWNTDFFLGGDELSNISVNGDLSERMNKFKAGIEELPMYLDTGNYFTMDSRPEKLYLVSSLYTHHTEAYTNKHALQVLATQTALPEQNVFKTAPLFLLFDQRLLSKNLLQKLRRVQF
ncbi:GNAT family N-acetyltransferase [Pseudoneobacillus sp. C159]